MKTNEIANLVLEQHPFTFRNDCGKAWVGGTKLYCTKDENIIARKGSTIILNPHYISYGLYKGSGDYIGWSPVKITLDMVGKTVAVFTSIETKTENDRIHEDQLNWQKRVREYGGIAEIWKDTKKGIIKQ